MLMGVPYELYWYGDPTAVWYYMEAYEMKVDQDRDLLDFTSWLTGAYIHEAINASLSAALSKTSRVKYPKEPHEVAEKRKRQIRRDESAVLAAFNEFAGIATMYNARLKALQGGVEGQTEVT